ncbi:Kynurenine/alpha-aminoadipate aminotransferase-like 4 [Homarus americanus]|uniref:Kynurenine/alpha-aminoadipate aminotransferase-like 4 n=1 Tax=Homarus americanus TaxID=6706 RepID=A0A8J5MKY2_HOMAM|nr:Kynurenine/alpha-aminoadipate aminotransferase-like 4 [Homarus americanus]
MISSSSLSQVVLNELLTMWGEDGLRSHIQQLRSYYKAQRDAFITSASIYLSGTRCVGYQEDDTPTGTREEGHVNTWTRIHGGFL